jgi:CRISPR system Cascade subunit CasA
MPFNLLQDPFFPVITRSGLREWLSFAELAEVGADEPVEFDWPRADLNIAALEFAIGVATLAFRPQKPSDWVKLWRAPPGPEAIRVALAPFMPAFVFDGDGPRFLQELGGLDGETTPIEALLIDTPGANGRKKNADVLTHRDRYPALGLPAAAMALYTLQQFAPSGGAGNRTSMRGGGPLSTFVVPGAAGGVRPSLWRIVLANLPQDERLGFEPMDLPKILPWLAPTLVSDKAHGERLVHEGDEDAHPLQAFFGMPRRVALRFVDSGICAMTGEAGPLVEGFVQKPWGMNYGLWTHPATPYRRQKEGSDPYSVKPKSAHFGYRDWTAVVVGETEGAIAHPAAILHLARHARANALRGPDGADATVRAAGWAMNNMEAVAYLSAERPLHLTADETVRDTLDLAARRLTQAAEVVVALLVHALKGALFSEGAKPATDKAVFEEARAAFHDATEDIFHDQLNTLLEAPVSDGEALARKWLKVLQKAAFEAFGASAPIPLDDPGRARRVADAFRHLRAGLSGYGKAGQSLLQILELPLPDTGAARKGKRNGN